MELILYRRGGWHDVYVDLVNSEEEEEEEEIREGRFKQIQRRCRGDDLAP